MNTCSGAVTKRVTKKGAASCVRTVTQTMYGAINNFKHDDGGGLTAGSATSRPSAHRRRIGRPDPRNIHTPRIRLAPR